MRVFKTGLKTDTGKDLLFMDTHYPGPDIISLEQAERQLKSKIPYNPGYMRIVNHVPYLFRSLKVPCGKCSECKLDHAREWSYRVLMEVKSSEKPCYFLTLTYAVAVKPNKKDLQLFMKRLRNIVGPDVRFFACGERGESNGRWHYHVILFNIDLPDLVLQDGAHRYYTSETISKAWQYGIHVLGDVTAKSAAYVARYTNKKTEDNFGFINMSRRPGIGRRFLEDHLHCYDTDSIMMLVDGTMHRITLPRYFEKIFPDLDLTEKKSLRVYNAERVQRLECFVHGLSPLHLDNYKRHIADYKASRLERNL